MRVHDISQPVGTTTAVWPGDEPFRLTWTMHQDAGDSVNVAALSLSAHTGTHADGPLHVDGAGAPAGAASLEPYVGPAVVLDVRGRDALGTEAVEGVDLAGVRRVLFRSRDAVDPTVFPARIAAIEPALARRLAEAGVKLVGTDAPSVDPLDSKTLETHRILGAGGVAILENLVLDAVSPGTYFLVAAPLRLVEADSSPVRALLIEGIGEG